MRLQGKQEEHELVEWVLGKTLGVMKRVYARENRILPENSMKINGFSNSAPRFEVTAVQTNSKTETSVPPVKPTKQKING